MKQKTSSILPELPRLRAGMKAASHEEYAAAVLQKLGKQRVPVKRDVLMRC